MLFERHSNHPDQLSLALFDEPPAPLYSPPPAITPTATAQTPVTAVARSVPPAGDAQRDDLRNVMLMGETVRYTFRRSARKTIGFMIDDEGLTVSAPRWVRLVDVDDALREKARWILNKLRQQRERREQLAARRIDWRDGAEFPFLGSPVRIKLDAHAVDTLFEAEVSILRLPLTADADARQIKDRVQAWLQRQAKRVFDERVALFAERLRVRVREVKLSSAATRWGTASADGLIRLNWRLVHFALPVIDYVAAHEVAHLREMHHGPAFWATVRSIFPEFEEAKAQLKDEALPQFDE
jgi:predicted metal-dependent hydrolase